MDRRQLLAAATLPVVPPPPAESAFPLQALAQPTDAARD
jgi:hypothetical protein